MSEQTTNEEQKDIILSLYRGLTILEILLEKGTMTITEMGRMLNINKSSAYRLLNTLKRKGFVEQDPETFKYKLGLRFLIFSQEINANKDLNVIVRPYLKKLSVSVRETAHLAVRYNNNAMIVEQESGTELLSVVTKKGDIEPLYCSAVGKVILAFLPKDEQRAVIDALELKKATKNTIIEKEQLKKELDKIIREGYAIDDEEYHAGVRCLASPIKDHSGKVIASMGFSGPSNRITLDGVERYIPVLKDVALSVSQKMGFVIKKENRAL